LALELKGLDAIVVDTKLAARPTVTSTPPPATFRRRVTTGKPIHVEASDQSCAR
jgi:hypothetical protein